MRQVDNIEFYEDYAVVKVDPRIFSLDIVFMAAYVMVDRAYVFVTGDPKVEIRVQIRSFDKEKLEEVAREFNNQLLNYAVYDIQSRRTADLRKILLAKALLSNLSKEEEEVEEECEEDYNGTVEEEFDIPMDDSVFSDYREDPENITIPWYNLNKEEKEEFFKAVKDTIGEVPKEVKPDE